MLLAVVIPRGRIFIGPTSGAGIQSILPGADGLYFPEKSPFVPTEA